MPPTDFFGFLARSIDLLKQESCENYERIAIELQGVLTSVSTGTNTRLVWFDDGQFAMETNAADADVWIEFEEPAILDLIDGKYSLEQAVIDGGIFIKGNVRTIEEFYTALTAYLNGALRSPGFPALLADYRRTLCLGE
jgi:hypothetical protein